MIVRSACLSLTVMMSVPISAHAAFTPPPAIVPRRRARRHRTGPIDHGGCPDHRGKGEITAAQKRGTDLETAWDEAEDTLKPTDPAR